VNSLPPTFVVQKFVIQNLSTIHLSIYLISVAVLFTIESYFIRFSFLSSFSPIDIIFLSWAGEQNDGNKLTKNRKKTDRKMEKNIKLAIEAHREIIVEIH
jgi:hypothetical protein